MKKPHFSQGTATPRSAFEKLHLSSHCGENPPSPCQDLGLDKTRSRQLPVLTFSLPPFSLSLSHLMLPHCNIYWSAFSCGTCFGPDPTPSLLDSFGSTSMTDSQATSGIVNHHSIHHLRSCVVSVAAWKLSVWLFGMAGRQRGLCSRSSSQQI